MPPNRINAADLCQMLSFIAETMAKQEAHLNALDAAIGDGDHGTTMRVGFTAIRAKVATLPDSASVDLVLREAGLAFMGATGGAIGVLLGKMLMAAGSALRGFQKIGPEEFRTALTSMESALVATGKAKPGDKTILDAVHPANETLASSTASQGNLLAALKEASQAARLGAESTAQMLARIGRASRLGDRVLGNPDPAAVSFSIILGGMAEWLQQHAASAQ